MDFKNKILLSTHNYGSPLTSVDVLEFLLNYTDLSVTNTKLIEPVLFYSSSELHIGIIGETVNNIPALSRDGLESYLNEGSAVAIAYVDSDDYDEPSKFSPTYEETFTKDNVSLSPRTLPAIKKLTTAKVDMLPHIMKSLGFKIQELKFKIRNEMCESRYGKVSNNFHTYDGEFIRERTLMQFACDVAFRSDTVYAYATDDTVVFNGNTVELEDSKDLAIINKYLPKGEYAISKNLSHCSTLAIYDMSQSLDGHNAIYSTKSFFLTKDIMPIKLKEELNQLNKELNSLLMKLIAGDFNYPLTELTSSDPEFLKLMDNVAQFESITDFSSIDPIGSGRDKKAYELNDSGLLFKKGDNTRGECVINQQYSGSKLLPKTYGMLGTDTVVVEKINGRHLSHGSLNKDTFTLLVSEYTKLLAIGLKIKDLHPENVMYTDNSVYLIDTSDISLSKYIKSTDYILDNTKIVKSLLRYKGVPKEELESEFFKIVKQTLETTIVS